MKCPQLLTIRNSKLYFSYESKAHLGFWKSRYMKGSSMSMSVAASLKTDFLKK